MTTIDDACPCCLKKAELRAKKLSRPVKGAYVDVLLDTDFVCETVQAALQFVWSTSTEPTVEMVRAA